MSSRLLAHGMLGLATAAFVGLVVLAFAAGYGPGVRHPPRAPVSVGQATPEAPIAAHEGPEASEAASIISAAPPATAEVPAVRRDTVGAVYPAPALAPPVSGETARGLPASEGPRRRPRAEGVRGVVVLDPGHGHGDPGAVHRAASGQVDLTEEETTLAVAMYAADALRELGYDVYLTRRSAGFPALGPLTQAFIVADLFSRVALARSVDADVYVAVHANGSPYDFHQGTEVWYCGKSDLGEANRQLAELLLEGMLHGFRTFGYDAVDRGLREDAEARTGGEWCPLVVTREAPAPSALVELLFMTNDDDARTLASGRARRLVGRGIARAIDQFLVDRGVAPPE